jgi:DNA-binding CsgD family transcriptional regulator
MEMKDNQFNTRGFTSLLTAAGFLLMALSGIAAYVVPHGRIAYWTDWSFLGLTKTNWGNIHVIASLLFLVAGAFHVYFNWRPLTAYIVGRTGRGTGQKGELAITLAALVFIVLSAIYRIPPLSYFVDLSESAKGAWVSREYEPPFGRAELLGLNSFCKKTDIPLEQAVTELAAKGISVLDVSESLQDMGKRVKLSPLKVYMVIKRLEGKSVPAMAVTSMTPQMVEETYAGSGIGRKTFTEIASSMNLDVATVRTHLAAMNFEVKVDEPLKQAAERNGLQPIELLKAVLIEGYKPQK